MSFLPPTSASSTSRAQLLASARRDRELREQRRREQEQAAGKEEIGRKLLRWWRSHRDRRRGLEMARKEWDEAISFGELNSSSKTLPPHKLVLLAGQLTVLWKLNNTEDLPGLLDRTEHTAKLLVAVSKAILVLSQTGGWTEKVETTLTRLCWTAAVLGTGTEMWAQYHAGPAFTNEERSVPSVQSAFARESVGTSSSPAKATFLPTLIEPSKMYDEKTAVPRQLSFQLRLLLTYMNPASYRATASSVGPTSQLCNRLHSRLVDRNCFYTIVGAGARGRLRVAVPLWLRPKPSPQEQKDLRSAQLWLGAFSATASWTLSSAPVGPLSADRIARFCAQILSVPLLVHLLDDQGIELLRRSGAFATAVEGLGGGASRTGFVAMASGEAAALAASNLCEWHRRMGVEATGEGWGLLANSSVPNPSVATAQSTTTISRSHPAPNAATPPYPAAVSAVAMDLRDVAEVVLGLVRGSRKVGKDAMSGVAYGSGIVPAVFTLLTLIGPSRENGLQTLLVSTKDPGNEPMAPVMEMLFESAHLLFLTLSDEEIYNRQQPLTLSQLSSLSSFLNSYCFYLHLKGTQSVRPSLTEAALKLLGALYDRNDRRAWVTELPEKKGVAGFFAGIGLGGKGSDSSPWIMPEMAGKRLIEEIRKGDPTTVLILNTTPQTIPFRTRVDIFREMVKADKATVSDVGFNVRIRRRAVLEDGFTYLAKLSGVQFKQTFRIVFVNELGMNEAGVDQHGVFKEFIELLLKKAFSAELGLFKPTADNTIYPSSKSGIHENHLELLHFTGRMLAKALYEGIVIDYPFALFFYSKLLSQYTCLDDLPSLDPELYKNLTFLKHYEGDCSDLGLSFTIDEDIFGKKVSQVYLMADYVLNQQAKDQNRAFIKGFKSVVSDAWLRPFSASELQKLMSGEGGDFDPKELRTYTRYEGGFFDQHKTIRWLWQCVEEMSPKEKSAFLRFVTSCSKPPVGGFQHLQPTFTVRAVTEEGGENAHEPTTLGVFSTIVGFGKDSSRLPTAATCFNLLKLPVFKSKQNLKEKLLYAINANAGFELA
ncbi:hypothetical protein HDU93_002806 [Gonapodya sp. JEL0774]|nr:hypothetical protein HDU93_002806 [Gonapodya sp. JEL0774]